MPSILLLGGAGKISLHLTPLILSRSWRLTSVIRDPAQEATICTAGAGQPGKLTVLVRSLEDVRNEADAREIVKTSGAECVIWSAGAGGKGGASRTYAIDRDACIHFIRASASLPQVTTFLLISYIGSRRAQAPWWDDSEWAASQSINKGALKDYHLAKVAADECLTAVSRERGEGFRGICLRPGTLTDDMSGDGRVSLGKTKALGRVSRVDVAKVAVELLESGFRGGWLDLLEGEDGIADAVRSCVEQELDCAEGEDLKGI